MAEKRTCAECGTELPANAPQGLCPRCLANMGLSLLPDAAPPKSDFQIERTGTMIGRYKLLEKIGEGGFGVVYMAEQQEPVQRKVALKIIKPGMDTREVIARFEAERQAIALMDNPNIARVLDAGATEAGRPYFVMELVRGVPITDYCDQKNLPTRERLQLFMKVCQAVQHAHQKAVIHRDLKPSNVLVTEHDGEPVPKVIDFGVAKALGQKLTEKTLFTGFHHMLGTPAYMSPEQAALSGLDIDTRADIYSLGVLLYELLTGVTPFDTDTFRKAALDEIRRMIRETEPPKPSTRLLTLGQKVTDVASRRGTVPTVLRRLVRGDLDWIVMKCLEKDRKRRYETANGLAADVARHMDSEPVVARAPGNLYRFQKLVRRHKVAFSAVSAVGASLVIGLGVSMWLFVKEKEARQEAVNAGIKAKSEATRAESEKQKAQSEANRSQLVAHYLKNMLDDIAPSLAKGCTRKYVQEVLARADTRFGEELKDQPDIEAMVRTSLAEIQGNIGQYDNAETNLRRALEIYKELFGNESSEVAASQVKLAELLRSAGKRLEAEALYQEAITMFEQLVRDNPKNQQYRLDLGHNQWGFSHALAETHMRDAAMQVMSNALQVFGQATHDFPGNPYFRQEHAFSHRLLGNYFEGSGQIDQSVLHYRTAIESYTALIEDNPTNVFYHGEEAYTTWGLATILERAGRLDAATAEYRQALTLYDKVIASFPSQPDFKAQQDLIRGSLVSLLNAQGKRGEADALLGEQSPDPNARQSANVSESAGLPPATNLILNGSFELPAHAGNGRAFSSEESFKLPGWTFSLGSLQFFLEYGEPLRRVRYADGRQAVCLNGDGRQPPITLAQTFATTPGEDYTLRFAQGDEQMTWPSTSELTVSIADVERVFSREHDIGMVFKTLHFTARSNLTTLRFADTSPNIPDAVHSPFLDAVSVVQGNVEVPITNTGTAKIGTAKLDCQYPAELLVSPGGKASWSPGSDRIVFTKLGGGLAVLELQSRKISDLTRVGNDPAWSPDGRWIAYVTSGGEAYYSEEVWIVPAAGGQPINVGHGGFPSWSADSQQVFFQDRKAGKILAAQVNAKTEEPSVFFDNALSWYPAISPDGDRIAFGTQEKLLIMDRKTGKTVASLATADERGLLPAWSPDGRQVAFGGFAGSRAGLWIFDVSRGGAFQVATNGDCTMPAWSPDGKHLVFDFRGDPNEIWMIETTNLPSQPDLVTQLPSRLPAQIKQTAMDLVGKPVPGSFKLPLLDGGEFAMPDPQNTNVLLLDFCATWCGPCRQAMPVLDKIAKDYAARGVSFVEVDTWGENPEVIRRYLTNAGLKLTVALDKGDGMASAFRVKAIPTMVVVDRSNIIRYVRVGYSPGVGDEIRSALDEALKTPSSLHQAFPESVERLNAGTTSQKTSLSTPRLAGIINLPDQKTALLDTGPKVSSGSWRWIILNELESQEGIEVIRIHPESGSVELRLARTNAPVTVSLPRQDNNIETAGGSIEFVNAGLDSVLDLYAKFKGRTLLRSPRLAVTSFTLSASATNRAQAGLVLEKALVEQGIVTIPDGDKFLMVVPESEASSAKPRSAEIKISTTAESNPEQIPVEHLRFIKVDLRQVAQIYAALIGRKLDLTQGFARATGFINFHNQTPLSKEESVYALDTLFSWQGVKVEPVGDELAKLVAIPSGEK